MSDQNRDSDSRVINVDVEAIGKKLYVGDGLKPGAVFELMCGTDSVVEFEGRMGDPEDKGKVPLEGSKGVVKRNTRLEADGRGAVSGRVLTGLWEQGQEDEHRFHFGVAPKAGGQKPAKYEYRLAISGNGHVDWVQFNLASPLSQHVYYKGASGEWTFVFRSRHPERVRDLQIKPLGGSSWVVDSRKSPEENEPKVIAVIRTLTKADWGFPVGVASLSWPTGWIPTTPVSTVPLLRECGGTESVEIFVDPDHG